MDNPLLCAIPTLLSHVSYACTLSVQVEFSVFTYSALEFLPAENVKFHTIT